MERGAARRRADATAAADGGLPLDPPGGRSQRPTAVAPTNRRQRSRYVVISLGGYVYVCVVRESVYPESEEPNEALVHSIARLPELQEVLADATDLGLAALVENDMLDAIPIVAWVRRFAKGGIAIRDALLARKLIKMLRGVGAVSDKDRDKWNERLGDRRQAQNIGLRLFAILDKLTDEWKAELVGRLLRRYLDGDLTLNEFLRGMEMIERAFSDDLRRFLAGEVDLEDAGDEVTTPNVPRRSCVSPGLCPRPCPQHGRTRPHAHAVRHPRGASRPGRSLDERAVPRSRSGHDPSVSS
jgi:hypothetical protein